MQTEPLHPDAFAIRPVWLINDHELRYYEAVSFPQEPWGGIDMWLRRVGLFDHTGLDAALSIDILNQNGDIIQEWKCSKLGHRYLRLKLKLKVDPPQFGFGRPSDDICRGIE